MNPFGDKLFNSNLNPATGEDDLLNMEGPFTGSFMEALSLLTKSADMGHLQAKHRLGMIYSKGFELGGVLSVRPECKKALEVYKDFVTTAGTTVTKRMRAAYKQYTVGDYESSLRNYLAAAETGSIEAQVNAAFLLEEGHCLGLSHLQCMKASVRLWRAAAKSGHVEAYLKVGDFYYYGRLREDVDFDGKNSAVKQRDIEFSVSPLPWARYILYPEDLIPKLRKAAINAIRFLLEDRNKEESRTCEAEEGSCINQDSNIQDTFSKEQKDHFKIAAKYYRTAATESRSARANFNLGFMHEWGLGLAQDFPLAKRYYDLASEAAQNTGDGALANQIALFCMNIHEYVVKLKTSFDEGLRDQREQRLNSLTDDSSSPLSASLQSSTRVTSSHPSTRFGIIIYHILTWESTLILLFTVILTALIQKRNARRQQR
jgi:TPR repeat protein